MSTLDEIGAYLDGLGIADVGTDLFKGLRPDFPDKVLVLMEYPGNAPSYIQNQNLPSVERPQIQVVARDVKYEDARSLAQRAWNALAIVTNATLSGTKYLSIRPNSSPAILAVDTNNRVLIFFNASVEKEVPVVVPS